jgi:hypothetical protein
MKTRSPQSHRDTEHNTRTITSCPDGPGAENKTVGKSVVGKAVDQFFRSLQQRNA